MPREMAARRDLGDLRADTVSIRAPHRCRSVADVQCRCMAHGDVL